MFFRIRARIGTVLIYTGEQEESLHIITSHTASVHFAFLLFTDTELLSTVITLVGSVMPIENKVGKMMKVLSKYEIRTATYPFPSPLSICRKLIIRPSLNLQLHWSMGWQSWAPWTNQWVFTRITNRTQNNRSNGTLPIIPLRCNTLSRSQAIP